MEDRPGCTLSAYTGLMNHRVRHLYVHVPFCPTKCSYCAFVTHVGSLKMLPAYIQAVMCDASREAGSGAIGRLETVYFGGGTPSMMDPEQTRDLLTHFHLLFGLSEDCEVTLEAHPTTVDQTKLSAFRASGVTRISFGAESLQSADLEAVGRRYHPDLIPEVVRMCRNSGFDRVAMDLIYGLPNQTLASWSDTLRRAIDTGVGHLSLYPLSIEPRTVFSRRRRQGSLLLPPDELVVEMYARACSELRQSGFIHYEVANWAKPEYMCRHNLAYWQNHEYGAIGVGAHGYVKPWRTERLVGTRRYIDALREGADPVARREKIDADIELRESIMLGLRLLQQGIDLSMLEKQFGVDVLNTRTRPLVELTAAGLIDRSDTTVRLTERAVPVANEVWAALM